MDTEELESSPSPPRRLIIVVVEPGEDPVIDYEPEGSFATWEVVAALHRAVEIIEQEDMLEQIKGDEDDNGEPS